MKQFDLQGNEYDCQIEQNHSVIVTKLYSLEKQIEKKDKEIEILNNIINELEKCIQNYIYAIEPRGCSINYNCEYDSEEDYINAMKEQSTLNTFKFILNKIKELKGSDK